MITSISFYVSHFEIDKMSIVHHTIYPKWFEIGRRDYLHKAGIPYSNFNRQGFYLPLSEMECKYKSPAKYGDEITVLTDITFMSCVMVKFEYKVLNKTTGKPLVFGNTVHAWTDRYIKPLNIEKAAPKIYTLLKEFSEKEDII